MDARCVDSEGQSDTAWVMVSRLGFECESSTAQATTMDDRDAR
ncbi:MAG: hypothetical protein OJF52_002986 [Nitrospira sp.]|nr:MAG: hypothetical protein OJF52_002986 [Nitrospira sp.]